MPSASSRRVSRLLSVAREHHLPSVSDIRRARALSVAHAQGSTRETVACVLHAVLPSRLRICAPLLRAHAWTRTSPSK